MSSARCRTDENIDVVSSYSWTELSLTQLVTVKLRSKSLQKEPGLLP